MRITHLGHSCLFIETDDARVLIDPGTLSNGFEELRDLDAIVVTHQHPDHVDQARLGPLASANPSVRLLLEPSVVSVAGAAGADEARITAVAGGGQSTSIGDLTITPVGAEHAVIHRDIPRVGNTGFLITSPGGPTLYHPGDAIDSAPQGVDLLAAPISAPWCALKETVDWVREVGPAGLIPIHDGVLAPAGRSIYLTQLVNLGGKTPDGLERQNPLALHDLAGQGAVELT